MGEADADAHRDDGHRDRGEQFQRRRGHEGEFESAHGRHPVPLAHLVDDLDLAAGPAITDERGQAPHDVEKVPAEGGERGPAFVRVVLGRLADQGREERQQGQGEHDDEGAQPVNPDQGDDGEHRHDHGGDERGEEARGIRLDGGGALRGERDRAIGGGAALGRERQPPGEQGPPQRGRHLDPGPGGDPFGDPGKTGPRGEQAGAPHHRHGHRVAADDGDDERGDRKGEPDRRQPLDDPHDRQDGDRRSGRRRRPEQSWIEGSHKGAIIPYAAVSRPGPARGCGGSRSACGRPSTTTPCRRARSG